MKKNKFLEFIKNYWLLILIVFWPIVIIVFMSLFSSPSTKQKVHWHMPISYNLCWDTTQLKDSWKHWKLHWHDDKQVHVEWVVDMENRNETLWAFFDAANIVFSKTQIWKYKNWDTCKWSNVLWKVSVMINWKENFEFRDYIMNDKDDIKVIFK